MRDSRLVLVLLVLVACIAILYDLTLEHYWFWTIWWIDVVLHVLGGFAIGLMVIWAGTLMGWNRAHISDVRAFFLILGLVTLIGIGWEVFEYQAGMFVVGQFFPDTYHDLFSDIAGGLIAYVYYHFLKYPLYTRHD
jgi:hypothetical protein